MSRIYQPIGAITLALLVGACSATRPHAEQPSLSRWTAVERLPPGTLVEITEFDRTRHEGVVGVVDGTGLALANIGRITRDRIRRVTRIDSSKSDSVANGTLIGSAIGAAYAAGVVAYLASEGDDGQGTGRGALNIAIGAGVGALVGAGIDRLRNGPRKTVVYQADAAR